MAADLRAQGMSHLANGISPCPELPSHHHEAAPWQGVDIIIVLREPERCMAKLDSVSHSSVALPCLPCRMIHHISQSRLDLCETEPPDAKTSVVPALLDLLHFKVVRRGWISRCTTAGQVHCLGRSDCLIHLILQNPPTLLPALRD